jgi:hypothetical protein
MAIIDAQGRSWSTRWITRTIRSIAGKYCASSQFNSLIETRRTNLQKPNFAGTWRNAPGLRSLESGSNFQKGDISLPIKTYPRSCELPCSCASPAWPNDNFLWELRVL